MMKRFFYTVHFIFHLLDSLFFLLYNKNGQTNGDTNGKDTEK